MLSGQSRRITPPCTNIAYDEHYREQVYINGPNDGLGNARYNGLSSIQACRRDSKRRKNLESQDSERSNYLRQMFNDYMAGRFKTSELMIWDGPYGIVLDYLALNDSEGRPTRSAQMFYLIQWANNIGTTQSTVERMLSKTPSW